MKIQTDRKDVGPILIEHPHRGSFTIKGSQTYHNLTFRVRMIHSSIQIERKWLLSDAGPKLFSIDYVSMLTILPRV